MRTELLLTGFMTLCLLGGCAGTPLVVECGKSAERSALSGPALMGQSYGPQMSAIPLNAVQYTDALLTKRVAVQTMFGDGTGMDTVSVGARFVNCSDQPVALGVRTSFLDTKQRPTEAPSAWQTVFVPPKASANYSEVSIGRSTVAHYVIEIRDAAKTN
jgi:hypothetical protein